MNKLRFRQWLRLLTFTILSVLIFEHSQLDVRISELFYAHGNWLLKKNAQPYAFIFYDLPKALLILFGLYLLTILLVRYWQHRHPKISVVRLFSTKLITRLSRRDIGYLLIVLIIVPTIIATLKGITHVSCPNHLYFFDGDLPYLSIWQNMRVKTAAKCFPAAHASAGFALYGFSYLPSLQQHRVKIIIIVTIVGWSMGLYKMFIGDHFFSHTLVSMLLSWTIACGLATIIFKDPSVNKTAVHKISN